LVIELNKQKESEMSRATRINQFITDIKFDSDFSFSAQVRLPSTNPIIKTRQADQLRSKKHTADGIAWDVLGNATVLWADGSIRQYISNKEMKAVGIK
jgi:hypothetical protein